MESSFHTHGGIRTHDPLLRRQLLYPTELRERLWFANIAKSLGFRQMNSINGDHKKRSVLFIEPSVP